MRLRDELEETFQVVASIGWGGLRGFTVSVDGRTVFSRQQAGRLPRPGEIARLVRLLS